MNGSILASLFSSQGFNNKAACLQRCKGSSSKSVVAEIRSKKPRLRQGYRKQLILSCPLLAERPYQGKPY